MSEGTTRRGIMRAGGIAAAGVAAGAAGVPGYPPPSPIDAGGVQDGRVAFPPWRGEADPPGEPPPAPLPPEERVGFAIIGLGRVSLEQVLPAFAECRMARPVALVSGSPEKARLVARQYGIRDAAVHGYDQFDRLRDDPAVQAVYVALPNAMHRGFTERAAAIGKHVMTEKPMATSSEDCAMIAACAQADVRLMVAYRCQYEQVNRPPSAPRRAARWASCASSRRPTCSPMAPARNGATAGAGRRRRVAGYRALLPERRALLSDEEPVEVFAQSFSPPGDERFREVEESMSFTLRFPSGLLAQAQSSYGAYQEKSLRRPASAAACCCEDAFAYQGQRLHLFRRDGEHGVDSCRRSIHATSSRWRSTTWRAACARRGGRIHRARKGCAISRSWKRSSARRERRPEAIPALAGGDTARGPSPDPG